MKKIDFRTLRADEIEVRPATIQNGKATMLLYIDSRAVVNLLNETVGAMNWQSEFYDVNGQTVGKIGIYDEDRNIWVWKSDVGSESNIEAQKGLISDTYKRCLSRWGVQELYTAPRITIDDDGYKCSGYQVSEIAYDDNRNITHLVIANRFGKEAFRWDKGTVTTQPTTFKAVITKDNLTALTEFCSSKKLEFGVDVDDLKRFFKFYKDKANTWDGPFKVDSLYNRWVATKKAA